MKDDRTNSCVVIKVGGSLLGWPELPGRLAAFLARLRDQDPTRAEKHLLIAGGGEAVDVVRMMDRVHHLGETRAHWLAIRAMDFTAELLAAVVPGAMVVSRPEELSSARNLGMIPVLAPRRMLEEIDSRGLSPLLESWDVTSDSIAARIAIHLTARRLILLKSKAVPHGDHSRGSNAPRTGRSGVPGRGPGTRDRGGGLPARRRTQDACLMSLIAVP